MVNSTFLFDKKATKNNISKIFFVNHQCMLSFLWNFKWKKIFDTYENEIWEICWVVFNLYNEKIIWFRYKKSFLKYNFFLLEDILSNHNNIFHINEKSFDDHNIYDLILKQVRDICDSIVWNIEDIEFDMNYNLKKIIIDCGYNVSSIEIISPTKIAIKKNIIKIQKKSVLFYEKDFIVIENKNIIKENKKTLENLSKIFINIPNPSYNINLNKYEL